VLIDEVMRTNKLIFLLTILLFLITGFYKAYAQPPKKTIPELRSILATEKADTNRVKYLLDLGYASLQTPANTKKNDTLLMLTKEAGQLSDKLNYIKGKGNTLLLRSAIFFNSTDKVKALIFARNALAVFSKVNDQERISECYIKIAELYDPGNDLKLKIVNYQKALVLFKVLHNQLRSANTLQELGDLLSSDGRYNESLTDLKSALLIYQTINYKDLTGLYDLLGIVSSYLGLNNDALKYGLLSVKTAEMKGEYDMQLCTVFNRLGMTYFFLHDYPHSLFYYEKGIAVAKKFNNIEALADIYSNKTDIYTELRQYKAALAQTDAIVKLGNIGGENSYLTELAYFKIYMYLNNQKLALLHLTKMEHMASKLNDLNVARSFSSCSVSYYKTTHQFTKCYSHLGKLKLIAQKEGSLRDSKNVEELWFMVDSAAGNFRSAFTHLRLFKKLNDSITNTNKNQQIAKLQVEYDLRGKNKDLALKSKNIELLQKQALIKNNQVSKSLLLRNMVIGGSLMLCILLAVVYNRYRIKLRSNILLELQRSEINQQNLSLKKLNVQQLNLLQDKEWLLREIHHRVKNNLQTTMSLLNMQSAYIDNAVALETIRNSQRRMHAMSLIHQKLYQSEKLTSINMEVYIEELTAYLKESFAGSGNLSFKLETQPVSLDISQAIPVGLIINEAVTNAIKYAFTDNMTGLITICLNKDTGDVHTLIIKDNGIGLPDSFNSSPNSSLGMNLMNGLARQLQGDINILTNAGTQINVTFGVSELIMNNDDTLL
jgi:two-component sensor histidine kinase